MISALAWIRKGTAKPVPEKFELSEEQYADIMQRATAELAEAREGLEEAKKEKKESKKKNKSKSNKVTNADMMEVDESLAKFHLSDYDEEDEGVFGDDVLEGPTEDVLDLFMQDVKSLAKSAEADPYLSKAPVPEDEESDEDDLKVRPTDSLVVTCKTADDVSYLEVNLYEEDEDNSYVHHDLMLPTFPLCVEPISFPFQDPTNDAAFSCHAAVGTFDPEIEIWSLDVLDAAYPSVVLGASEKTAKKTKSKAKKNPQRHVDAVMCLAWNKAHRSMLLSGSADTTVKLWDLGTATAIRSFEHHTDKVQVVQWNPQEASKLITASYDGSLVYFDARAPGDQLVWKGLLESDVESLKWNPHDPFCFAVSEENGTVHYVDSRNPSAAALFKLQAHSKATTSVDFHPTIPGCMLTASMDKSVKVWKMNGNAPSCVLSREPGVGKVFSASFCPDSTFVMAAAGSRGELRFFNLAKNETIIEAFAAPSS